MTDLADFPTGCGCIECKSILPHEINNCLRDGKWFIAIHCVDSCTLVEGGSTQAVVCQRCFNALIASAEAIINWGLLGVRYPLCGSCHKPILKLSDIVEDIAKV